VNAFTQAKNEAVAALEEIDKMKFDTLSGNFKRAIGEAVTQAVQDIDTLTQKIQTLDSKNVKITFDLAEGTA